MGDQYPDHQRGDIIFKIQQQKDNVFQRVGDHLFKKIKINLKDVLHLRRQFLALNKVSNI